MDGTKDDGRRTVILTSLIGGLVAGLCCLAPIVMVLLGLTSVTVANNWGNLLYGEYKWHFRIAALILMAVILVLYFRSRGVCTIDEARRQRNRIINLSVLAIVTFQAVYVLWTYVILHWWGIAAGLPWAQWDESWAIPASIALIAATAVVYWWVSRDRAKPVATKPDSLDGQAVHLQKR